MKGGPTPHALNNIKSIGGCRGWPHAWEVGYWLVLIIDAIGLPNNWGWIISRILHVRALPDVSSFGQGPGTELALLIASLNVPAPIECECKSRAIRMNAWGADGCRDNLDEIVGWLRTEARIYDRRYWIVAAYFAVRTGVAWRLYWPDPMPSLVLEAMRRAQRAPSRQVNKYADCPATVQSE